MKILICILLLSIPFACTPKQNKSTDKLMIEQSTLTNPQIKKHAFLECMYQDTYFPKFLVDKCRTILLELCANIETNKPADTKQLYLLTHAATHKLNELQDDFFANNSELETVARECLAANFEYIARAYDFEADTEQLIATREW